MTNYPITDPAEIDKLPDGWYESLTGRSWKKVGSKFDLGGDPYGCSAAVLADCHGGIACRLVPEGKTVTEPLPGGEDRDCSDVAAHAIVKRAEAETQRDELAALLRRLTHNVAHGRIVRCPDRCHAALVRESLVTECAAALAKLEENDDE
jgi:hypothetical protein